MLVQQEKKTDWSQTLLGCEGFRDHNNFYTKRSYMPTKASSPSFFSLSLQSFTYIDQADFELTKICLLLLPERTDQRCAPPHLTRYLSYFFF